MFFPQVTKQTFLLNALEGENFSVLHLCLFDRNVKLRVRTPADMLFVSHQHEESGSAGVRRDLDLSSVYRYSISLYLSLPSLSV